MSKHASPDDCPCCQRCLAPGLDTDRALVVAFLSGVAARDMNVSIGAALCALHARLAGEAAAFVAGHATERPS